MIDTRIIVVVVAVVASALALLACEPVDHSGQRQFGLCDVYCGSVMLDQDWPYDMCWDETRDGAIELACKALHWTECGSSPTCLCSKWFEADEECDTIP